MRSFWLIFLFLTQATGIFCQKRSIDSSCNDWLRLLDRPSEISNNGKYACFEEGVPHETSPRISRRLVIRATGSEWKQEVVGGKMPCFTEDSKFCLSMIPGDTLVEVYLGKNDIRKIPGVVSYKVPKNGVGRWLSCKYSGNTNRLELKDLSDDDIGVEFKDVEDYLFTNEGNALLLNIVPKREIRQSFLLWVDLPSLNRDTVIITSNQLSSFTFDDKGKQLAFLESVPGHGDRAILRYYTRGMPKAKLWIDDQTPGMDSGFVISSSGPSPLGFPAFSKDGLKFFFQVKRVGDFAKRDIANIKGVDVWNYRDRYLQSQQLFSAFDNSLSECVMVINQGEKKVVKLVGGKDYNSNTALQNGGNGDWLLQASVFNNGEVNPKLIDSAQISVVSLKDGSKKILLTSAVPPENIKFSTTGRFVIWYNVEERNYFTYNLSNGTTYNITKLLPVPVYDDQAEDGDRRSSYPFSMVDFCWLFGDSSILIYDKYDIWQIDPENKVPPINLTNGYGRKHQIVLRYIINDKSLASINKREVVLMGFQKSNKYNGFFKSKLGKAVDPEVLTMGPYIYYLPLLTVDSYVSFRNEPTRAKMVNVYLVRRMSATDCPNLFYTTDFKRFVPLSDFHLPDGYNWLTTELIHWKMPNGRKDEGVLYKPQDFNPEKKYPVIFYYYEELSDGLNRFLYPSFSDGTLNIPYFVSNGYVVCSPDIHYKMGYPGASAVDAVVSAARYLAQMPWADSNRMGLQGHSFGGYETNCIITHSHLFAAAASASGLCDLVSYYGTIRPSGGNSHQYDIEYGQLRLGCTLWERQDLFIENSPVFQADKVTTPVFIMQNKNDGLVPWDQGVEWFTALRRLNKKAWMVQYDSGGHMISSMKDTEDYSIRLRQFFDFYLRGAPEPKWMKYGIPSSEKGLDVGLGLEK